MRRIAAILFGLTLFTGALGCGTTEIEGNAGNQVAVHETEAGKSWKSEDGYLRKADKVSQGNSVFGENNTEFTLSVPTCVKKIDNTWFIVDCYHDQIIYNDNCSAPLGEWKVLTKDVKQPHTIAGDGNVLLVDDTENNRVMVFEKKDEVYENTQIFNDIGKRPHYTEYDEEEQAFYVLSSATGEIYVFRHEDDNTEMYLSEIRRVGCENVEPGVDEMVDNASTLNGIYIRSFYLEGDYIYFVSGIKSDGTSSGIIKCDKRSLDIVEQYPVSDEIAGMAALRRDGDYFYITVSTDVAGSQDAATMLRVKDLGDLSEGKYEEIYSAYFVGGGTPYNMNYIDGRIYLTEHRVPGHSIWSYKVENNEVTDVEALY
ncbi:hypothetical protein [Butyrivibrio sp. AC2005]|uniref:hypothetical protein n=1 Tax=Butyrivibrio sp. AC2005 TaxID=1280672 RepID=UPI0003FD869C|nr:hypothetical protein [Butyrivibrio sp. AC2005]